LEQYFSVKEESDENWLADFALWLGAVGEKEADRDHGEDEFTDILIGMQLINTSNILKSKMNKFVVDSPFATFLDYQFLFILKEHREMTKSELIFAHKMEMSSGIEVIKKAFEAKVDLGKAEPRRRPFKTAFSIRRFGPENIHVLFP